jgi:hypothetical protein
MPLPLPILDDRSYQQLRDELVRRIPVYAPEWTDFNPSDPGITLIELFAFLGENLLFRFNQIPESTKLQFLRLLDVPLRPPGIASGQVRFTTEVPEGVLVRKPTTVRAGSVPFQSTIETHAWPVSLRAVGRLRRGDPEEGEEKEFATRAWDARRRATGSVQNETPLYYATQTLDLDPTKPGAEALDLSTAVDSMLWVAVVAEKGADQSKLRDGILNVGIVPDEVVLSMTDVEACPGAGDGPRGPSIVWQLSTGQLDSNGVPRYATVTPLGDTTSGLTRPGVVRVQLPGSLNDFGLFPLTDPDMAGTGDFPPELDDLQILFWLRAFREDRGRLGRLLWVGANATEVEQVQDASPEFLGVGTGDGGQRAKLVHDHVVPQSLALDVEEATGWKTWREVEDFAASTDGDRHYVLDAEAGEVRFGDGVRGAAPQIGERIRATSYRYGGGTQGTVAPKAINKIEVADVTAENPLPTSGGAEAETIASGLERIAGELRRHDRAVTASDFRELALGTPGTTLGRAECLPLFYPSRPDEDSAGVVSVVIWPREDPANPNAPRPDRSTLRRVCRWLDARRLVTTELYVIPPTYRKVAVSVGIHVKPGFGVEAVRRWVELVLRQYLAPLPPYGPSGDGWPLGRRVHGPELEAAALQVDGVEFLEGLEVADTADDGKTWRTGTPILLERYEVPELVAITVVEGTPLDPGAGVPAPPTDGAPVPVPVPKEEC